MNYLLLLGVVFLSIIGIFLVFCKKENSRKILRIVYNRLIPQKFKDKSRKLFDSFYEDFPPFSFLLIVFMINIIVWLADYFLIYLIGLSLGIEINFIYFIIIMSISTLVAQIPITINGFGTRELTLIGLFGIFGISQIKVFSMSILNIFIMGILPSLAAILFIILERKNDIYHIKRSG